MKRNQPRSHESKKPDRPGAAKSVRARTINPAELIYRGHYDLAEFIAKYGLAPMEARDIFVRIGPTRSGLDRYMSERSIHLSN